MSHLTGPQETAPQLCPYDRDAFKDETRFTDQWWAITDAAQDMLDRPADAAAICDELSSRLMEQPAEAIIDTPARTAFLVARGVRNAVVSSLDHIVQATQNRLLLPAILRDEPLVPVEEETTASVFEYIPEASDFCVQGTSCDTFNRTMFEWQRAAYEITQDAAVRDHQHPFGLLHAELDSRNQEMFRAYQAHTGETHPFVGDRYFDYKALAENGEVAMRIFLSAGLSAEAHESITDRESLTSYAAKHLGRLAWCASTSRSVMYSLIPADLAVVFSDHEATRDHASKLRQYADAFSPTEGWAHKPLADGPLPQPICAGIRPLLSPDAQDQETADILFTTIEERYDTTLTRRENGAYDRATALLAFSGLNVANNTFYERWRDIRPLGRLSS